MSTIIAPVFVPKAMRLRGVNLNGHALTATGIIDDGEGRLVVLDNRLAVSCPMNKENLERFHLEKMRLDHLSRIGQLPFDGVRRGANPPDFVVNMDGQDVGLDLSALALSERRVAYSLFDSFAERLQADPRPFSNLQETMVLVWFGMGLDLPFKRTDRELADALINLLLEVEVDRVRLMQFEKEIMRDGFPSPFPSWYPIRSLPNQEAGFTVALLPEGFSGSILYSKKRFECRLQMSIFIDRVFVNDEIMRLVNKHDQHGTEWLVLTIGATDQRGCLYPGEDVIFSLAAKCESPVPTHYIRRITVHRWSTGESADLVLNRI